jgi:hypothetical protein
MVSRETRTASRGRPKRLFTVAEANAMLPLVSAITRDLVQLSSEVMERHERVEHLKAGREVLVGDPYHDELSQIEEELAKDRRRLNEYVEELRQLGVDPKSGVDGVIDFLAILDGERVCLCWKLGEPELLYWHPLNAGFSARQPLETAAVAEGADSKSCS